jgi:hypothetical protein
MFYGRGIGRGINGRGGGRGLGFSFRGATPPWPYVGRGRGGLPRCGYYLSGAGVGAPAYGAVPYPAYAPQYAPLGGVVTPEDDLDHLRQQAEAIRSNLQDIEKRMHDLESE